MDGMLFYCIVTIFLRIINRLWTQVLRLAVIDELKKNLGAFSYSYSYKPCNKFQLECFMNKLIRVAFCYFFSLYIGN